MDVKILEKDLQGAKVDMLAVVVSGIEKKGLFGELDGLLGGSLKAFAKAQGFEGKAGQKLVVTPMGQITARQLMLVGVGDKKLDTRAAWQELSASLVDTANQQKAETLGLLVSADAKIWADAAKGAILGAGLVSYRFLAYKTKDAQAAAVKSLHLQFEKKPTAAQNKALKEAVSEAQVLLESICVARDLVNEPPNVLNPPEFAKRAQAMSKKYKLTCEVLDDKQMRALGMNMFLAVGAGSAQPCRLIHMTYKPAKKPKKGSPVLALVGKGLTFDSGGLCIKPAASMNGMHADMGGAAAVFGAMQAVAQLKPDVEVHGYIAAAENMTGAAAFRVNDVVTAYNKKTVEILNTDAEGRLVLGDTLSYACDQGATEVIDLATLTGACLVALGRYTAGLMTNKQEMGDSIKSAGDVVGESFWQLPLLDDVREGLKSSVADMSNVGERWGGTISAGWFLREFVADGVDWTHLDIAGPAHIERDRGAMRRGGTGFGVATLIAYIQSR
ncbi:MAG: leucyl aminopeptidase [Myxococcales bacterium]|nr:leucyl aminopeptidase [Myxococcales bacterium]